MSDVAIHESFLVHRGLRYLKVTLLLILAAVALYIWHDPLGRPNGGTWLGYTLGGVSAALILWLTFFGIRKRRYAGGASPMRGWLSAHVYLGTALVVIATLHAGFQFGMNFHTLFYGLMVLTVASGLVGVICYARYPRMMTANRNGMTLDDMVAQIAETDLELRELAPQLPESANEALIRAEKETRLGGGCFAQLRGRDPNCLTTKARRDIQALEENTGAEASALRRALVLITRKEALLRRARRDIQIRALLRAWLFLHVPLAIATLVGLIAHVVAVFFYW